MLHQFDNTEEGTKTYRTDRSRRGTLRRIVTLTFVILAVAALSVAQSQSPQVGYRDFAYGTAASGTPTGEKPESKVWFNDGIWWGSLFNSASNTYHIYRLDLSTQKWVDTATQLDNRKQTKADCLWDAASGKLYVASHIFTTNGKASTSSSNWGRVYRYSYNSGSQSYSLDSGFPVSVNGGTSETIAIAKDTAGILWVTFTQGSKVWITHSFPGSENQWVTPYLPPTGNSDTTLASDDISSIIAFGPGKIGLMWSNQLTKKYHFMVHNDGDSDTTWQPEETAFPAPGGTENSDDHINMKTDGAGRLFVALKTSLTSSSAPLIELAVRSTGGAWSSSVYGLVSDKHSRPIVLLDLPHNRLYMFAVSPEGGSAPAGIYYKTSSISSISFPPGLGAPMIKNSLDTKLNNASSTKQNVDSSTGLLVIAGDQNTTYYSHNFLTLSGGTTPAVSGFSPSADPPGAVVTLTGSGFSGASIVAFNGQAAQFTADSDTQIHATVPTGAISGPITVSTNSGLVGTSSGSFKVTGSPVIKSFSPTSGIVGKSVTLSGSGFTATTSVMFNGTSAAFTFVSDSKLTTIVPAGATTGGIVVTNPAGTGTSKTDFTVIVAPTITGFTPSSGPVGTSVVITGSGFAGTTSVKFAGTTATFTVNSNTQITATVPSGAVTGNITVTNPAGTATSPSAFTVGTAAPTISSFTPTSGSIGASVTITGTGFTGATGVGFGGVAATTFSVDSDTQITATVPGGAVTGTISVTTPSGTATSSDSFTVQ